MLSKLCYLISIILVISTFPAFGTPEGAGENVLTNFELLEQVCAEATDELIENMPAIPEGSFILLFKARGVGKIEFVFENVLLKKMTDAGFRVTTKSPSDKDEGTEKPDYEFSYQIIRFTLKYPEISRNYWIGAKEVERLSEIGIFSQLIELSSGDIIWVGETQKKYEDTIAYSLLDRVEDPQHDFTKPPRKQLQLSRLVEPIIVTGIVTGLVYLFFSNQTSEE